MEKKVITNAHKYNARKYELLRRSESIIERAPLFKRTCSDCGIETKTRLSLQDNGPYGECETIGEFCEEQCFNSWWKKPVEKKQRQYIRCLR